MVTKWIAALMLAFGLAVTLAACEAPEMDDMEVEDSD